LSTIMYGHVNAGTTFRLLRQRLTQLLIALLSPRGIDEKALVYLFGSLGLLGPLGPVPAMESRMEVSAWMFLSE